METHPTGTVTFLFSDIEGSTKLAQAYPDKWELLRERHCAVLQSAMDAHNGYVFQIIGDAFCVSFHTASDGLDAAIEAQCILHAEDWGDTPIKVRMGIHTGEAELQSTGDYHGYLAMSRVQRLMSAGHGGQVLVSQATQELIRDNLPKAINLRDLGEKRLKDLIRPEHIYQLDIADLPVDFPALKTLDKYRHNLPVQLTSFIGREKEMTEVKQALSEHRLVTLTGSGGAGKTRLSLQVAADLLDSFPNGIWFVELASVTDPELLPQTILSAADMQTQQGRSALDSLKDFLREKTSLLILDNCEHLIEACAKLVDTVLHTAPNLKILASSREALGVNGEQAWHVPSLSIPDLKRLPTIEQLSQYEAVRLFIDRALLVQPHFVVTNDNAPAVAQICSRLDGIPLAVELAAARIKALKPEQIAERLNDRFRLLTGGSRTALPRQQTLRALIDWSYDLLSENEKILLRRLSVFMGGWTLEAAEAVCGNAEALDVLTRLVDKSLVSVDLEHEDGPRYYLLETVRQYAREKLIESGEGEFTRGQHLEYYMQLAEANEARRKTPEQMLAYKQMKMELDNFRLAQDWSLGEDTNDDFREKGLRLANSLDWEEISTEEGLNWLQKGLALISNDNPLFDLTRARSMTYLGRLFINVGEIQSGIDLLEKSLAIYQSKNPQNKSGWVDTLQNLAYAYINSDPAKVRVYVQDGVALAHSMGKAGHWDLGWALYWEGCAAYRRTEYETAKSKTEEGLAIFRQIGDNISAAGLLQLLGWIEMGQENYDAARTHLSRAQSIFSSLGLQSGAMLALMDIGSVERLAGRFGAARTCLEEVVAYHRDRGAKREMAYPLSRLGVVLIGLGEFELAAKTLRECLQLEHYSGSPFKWGGLFSFAKVLKHYGRFHEAARLLGAIEVEVGKDVWQLNAPLITDYNQNFETIKTALGGSEFASVYAEGKAMTLDQAISYVLEISI